MNCSNLGHGKIIRCKSCTAMMECNAMLGQRLESDALEPGLSDEAHDLISGLAPLKTSKVLNM